MRKQGRILTTEYTENTEGKEKGSKQYAPAGWSQAACADYITYYQGKCYYPVTVKMSRRGRAGSGNIWNSPPEETSG
jgi:hypothetical protein